MPYDFEAACAPDSASLSSIDLALQSFNEQVCKFWLQSRCLAGDHCRYAHPAHEPRPGTAAAAALNVGGGGNSKRPAATPPDADLAGAPAGGSAAAWGNGSTWRHQADDGCWDAVAAGNGGGEGAWQQNEEGSYWQQEGGEGDWAEGGGEGAWQQNGEGSYWQQEGDEGYCIKGGGGGGWHNGGDDEGQHSGTQDYHWQQDSEAGGYNGQWQSVDSGAEAEWHQHSCNGDNSAEAAAADAGEQSSEEDQLQRHLGGLSLRRGTAEPALEMDLCQVRQSLSDLRKDSLHQCQAVHQVQLLDPRRLCIQEA